MIAYLPPIAVGIVLMVFGINSIKGNINSIHSYHRHRVSEENKAIFGKLMGAGTIACSVGIILFGVLSLLSEVQDKPVLLSIGSFSAIAGLLIGVGIMVYATMKYNKGLF